LVRFYIFLTILNRFKKHFIKATLSSGPSGASKASYPGKQGISTVIIEKETLPGYKTFRGVFVNR